MKAFRQSQLSELLDEYDVSHYENYPDERVQLEKRVVEELVGDVDGRIEAIAHLGDYWPRDYW